MDNTEINSFTLGKRKNSRVGYNYSFLLSSFRVFHSLSDLHVKVLVKGQSGNLLVHFKHISSILCYYASTRYMIKYFIIFVLPSVFHIG